MAIQWRDNLYYLDSVKLPNDENTYWIKDTEAREAIETLSNATHFLGVTTTTLEDGATTNPITINSESVTAQSGDIVIYNAGSELAPENKEFIFNGTTWQEFGDPSINNLGALAYKDSASGSYTPEGSINLTPMLTNVVSSVSSDLGIVATISGAQTGDLIELSLEIEGSLTTSSISYFGSSQAVNYVNLASQDSAGSSYTNVVTNIDLSTSSVIYDFTPGELPTISNQSTVTVAMGTGSSSTTLIFNLSDIGFDSGTTPVVSYCYVYAPSTNHSDFTYASVSFLTLSPNTADIAYDVTGTTSLYYSIELTGDIETTMSSVLSGVTATFSGSASTITVS